uniref:Uncharacterized protein n=1 Tax=Cucumis melo TaxID=3656 RepID=A0A9I9E8H5_CUCME
MGIVGITIVANSSPHLLTVDQRPSNSLIRRKRKATGINEKRSLDESEKGGPKQKERISMAKGCSFSKNRCNEFNDFGTNRGPTANAMEELKLIGNYLKGSRPILTFSSNFDKDVLWKLMKEMIIQNSIIGCCFKNYLVKHTMRLREVFNTRKEVIIEG